MEMNNSSTLKIDPNDARLTGILYLTIAICGGFSIGYVPMQIVAVDPATTAANTLEQFGLFRLGVLADSAVILLEIAITAVLYKMFRETSPRLSLVAMLSRLGMIVVMGINLLIWLVPYILLSRNTGLSLTDSQALAFVFFETHNLGIFIWQLFFGAHLLALGAILLKTNLLPRLLGWGLLVGAFGYLFQGLIELTFTNIQMLDYAVIGLLVIVTISELGFGIWMLVTGLRGKST